MYVVRAARLPAVGDVAAPQPLNAEVGAILAQVNGGLDLENVAPGAITDMKVAPQELHRVDVVPILASVDQVTYDDSASPGILLPVLDGDGQPWVEQFTAPTDGVLRACLTCHVRIPAASKVFNPIHVVLLIDGVPVCVTDSMEMGVDGIFQVEGDLVVAGGEHTVEARYAHSLPVEPFGASFVYDFRARYLVLDFVCR